MSLSDHLFSAQGALWVWFLVLAAVNLAAIPFAIKDMRARVIVVATILLAYIVTLLYRKYGYTRILGLGHLIVWVPLFWYLWRNRRAHPERIWTRRYILIFLVINGISFALDFVDMIRYLGGDRSSY